VNKVVGKNLKGVESQEKCRDENKRKRSVKESQTRQRTRRNTNVMQTKPVTP